MLNNKLERYSLNVLVAGLFITITFLLNGCSEEVKQAPPINKPNISTVIQFSSADKAKIRHHTLAHRAHILEPFSKRYKGEYHYKPNDRLPNFYPRLPLPPHLERKLSPLPLGYTRIQIGDDYGIINLNTRVIYDIIYNAEPNI